jgi:hypothetical protein
MPTPESTQPEVPPPTDQTTPEEEPANWVQVQTLSLWILESLVTDLGSRLIQITRLRDGIAWVEINENSDEIAKSGDYKSFRMRMTVEETEVQQ